MKRMFIALLATLVAGLMFSLPESSAQVPGTGTLRLGVSQCPEGYTGDNYSVDCAVPATGIEFFIGSPNTDNVASGVSSDFEPITFDLGQFDLNPEAADTVWLGEPASQTSDYAASCTANQAPLPISYEMIDAQPAGPLLGIAFDFESGDDIVCNWYRLSLPMPGDPVVEPAESVIGLPATGTGSAVIGSWWR